MSKYLIVAGFVYSKDGDKHFIDSTKLISLYGVNRDECIIYDDRQPIHRSPKLIILAPRMNGDYHEYLARVNGKD